MIASKDNPIRCSRLSSIPRCSGRIWMLEYLDSEDSPGGEAAQTGSLVHAGVAEFHKTEGRLDARQKAAWDAIAANRAIFPLADETEVRLFLTPYINDPRNISAVMARMPDGSLAVEKQVEFTLNPHALDPTQSLIYINGTFDQVRLSPMGTPLVHDLKCGKPSAYQMIHDYAVQIAAYTYGAKTFWPNVQPGKIIRAYGYRMREAVLPSPDGVLISMPFTNKDLDIILDSVRLHVALLRMGDVQLQPGPHCTFCEHDGLSNCVPRLRAILEGAKPNDPFIQLGKRW